MVIDVFMVGGPFKGVGPGDKVIVISYADYDEAELDDYFPQVVHVDTANRPVPAEVAQQMANAEPGPVLYQEFDAES